MSILIVGSGLSALAVHKGLIDSGIPEKEIFLIDTNLRHRSSDRMHKISSAKKTLFGSDHMYEEIVDEKQHIHSLSLSRAAGGLSTVWGAGIRLWNREIVGALTDSVTDFYKNSLEILKVIPHFGDNTTLNIPNEYFVEKKVAPYRDNPFFRLLEISKDTGLLTFETPLAVVNTGHNACVACGMCLTGCPYSSIFNSNHYFDPLTMQHQLNRINGRVMSLSQQGKLVKVTYCNQRDEIVEENFGDVYLCTGALATPEILMRSDLIRRKIDVRDSQVFYFIGLYRRKKRRQTSEAFSLSQMTVTDDEIFSASLYACNSEIRNRISNTISTKLFGTRVKLPKMLDRFLFL